MITLSTRADNKLALIVDDSAMQRKMLALLLQQEGYRVITAIDGANGVEMYIKHSPDLVLMDITMPIMDGYEAARKIKSLSKGTLAPLIFITSMDSDQAFIEGIEAGGDGILVRPFSPDVFKAKIKSIQRISDLYQQVKKLQQEQQQDAELAEKLMSGVIESRNFSPERIKIIKQAATLFSGDIQLSALCPNGDINILLGDFTGHGLRSSIGAIPLAATFRAMTKKGFTLIEIIHQINYQLYDMLPTDLFLATAFVTVSNHDQSIYIFNAGIPDIYLIDNKATIKAKFSSTHPPLGVLNNLLPDARVTVNPVNEDDHVILFSDGIIEARNDQNEMFDYQRVERSIKESAINGKIAEHLIDTVNVFCHNKPQEDDLSIIEVPCGGWNSTNFVTNTNSLADNSTIMNDVQATWQWRLILTGARLAKVNPIPMAMNQIKEIEGSGDHWQSLYTILTELYVNALDHGVLVLDTSLKNSAEGFSLYFNEREARLKTLNYGEIDIEVLHFKTNKGGKIVIRIKDSGMGFEFERIPEKIILTSNSNVQFGGRGISLVKQLSNNLAYYDNGTLVEASFIW